MEESQSQSYAEAVESTAYGWLSLLSYTTQGHLPRGGTAHSELAPQAPVTNQGDLP